MSNKTSDKNVGSIDEKAVNDDIELIKNLIENNKIEIKNVSVGQEFRLLRTLQNILAEREQKDKRIKELEEERDHWHGCFIAALESSIPKRVVIDVIQEYKDKIERYNEYRVQGKETDLEYYENITNTAIVQVLQELLEGDSRNGRRN